MSSEFAINLNSGRLIKKTTSLYKKFKKMNRTKEIEDEEEPKVEKVKEPEPIEKPVTEEQFSEHKLQEKLADISTDLIKSNLKKVVKAQKLSDAEFDILLKKMLFKKLCINEQPKQPKEDKKKKKKSEFKIIEPSSSDSESSD